MHQLVRSLDSKVSEILGRQNHMVSMMSANQAQPVANANHQANPNQVPFLAHMFNLAFLGN